MRGKIVDFLLVVVALVAAFWLATLVYHNRLGGHVEHPDAAVAGDSGGRQAPR